MNYGKYSPRENGTVASWNNYYKFFQSVKKLGIFIENQLCYGLKK